MSNVGQIPRLRFPEFTGGWQEKRLKEIADVIGGGTPDTKNPKYWGGDIVWLTPSEVKNKYIDNSIRKISHEGLLESSAKILPINTVILTSRATVGDAAIARKELTTNQGFQSLVPHKSEDSEFLYYLVTTNKKEFLRRASGSTFLEISNRDVKNIPVRIPILEEQQKIAEFLAAVDKRVALLERKVQQLEAYKRGVMQQLFSQQLRFTRPDGSHFPAWQEKRLGEVFDAARGSSLSWGDIEVDGKNKAILYGQLYTVYPEVISQVVSCTNSNKGTPSKNGDLLLPNSTTTTGIDLANATALNEDGVLLGGDITVLRFKETGSNIFYAYYLSHFMKYKLAAYGQGSTIVHMYFSQYKNMKIVEPSAAEQQKIAEFLAALDEKIALTRQQLDKTKQFKKGLLQRMFV